MIPRPHLTAWAPNAPWPNPDQVEQDLLLSRLIIEIASDEYLGQELVFRGGTCLHKLRLSHPMRYSEDLDYVRRSEGGIGDLIGALRTIGERLGMKVSYQITRHPKVRFIAPFESGRGDMRIKIEMNTFERSPARPPEMVDTPSTRPGSLGTPPFRRSRQPSSSPPKSARCSNDRRAGISSTYGSG